MVIIKTIKGDLLDAKESYICQQCNCVTVKSQGLSKYISEKYSWADPYKIRLEHDEPGTIVELKHSSQQDNSHIILCFMAQWCPGKPNAYKKYYSNKYNDTYQNRKKWFQECLDILDENNYDMVAVPYGIGCGLAGGKWCEYKKMLEKCD